MKNRSVLYSIIFIIISLFSSESYAQEYQDCATANSPCGESPFHYDVSTGAGNADTGFGMQSCLMNEYRSTWIKWTIAEGGILTFVILPDTMAQDIDFIVFKLPSDDNCDDKIAVRCMASGANYNGPDWDACAGPTGLAIGEVDIIEEAGCDEPDNNFLAPLEVVEGESYVMIIEEFIGIEQGFTLDFGGTANIDCITLYAEDMEKPSIPFVLAHSALTNQVTLELINQSLFGAQLTIYNLYGQSVYLEGSINRVFHQIDMSNMPKGFYIASVRKDGKIFSKTFIVN